MTNTLDVFGNTLREVRSLEIPSRDAVEAMVRSAQRMVAMDLAENNIKGAIDTHHKTKAIEDYIKAKVRHQQADLITANIITAGRYMTIWEIGNWLNENMVPQGTSKRWITSPSDRDEYGYWYDDIGIHSRTGWQWKLIGKLDRQELKEYLDEFTKNGNNNPGELKWNILWSYVNPREPREPEKDPDLGDLELSPAGMKLYKTLRDVRKKTIEYFDSVNEKPVKTRELLFLAGMFANTRKGVAGAEREIRKALELAGEEN